MDPGVDFTYFNSAPLPYGSFFGLPPTPQSNTPQLEDFRNTHGGEHFDPAFAAFQQNFHYDPNQFVAQPQAQPQVHRASQSIQSASPPTVLNQQPPVFPSTEFSFDSQKSQTGEASPEDQQAHVRSSSEEKDNLTPQQNKRKAQNRAAQRAFRERKEKHVKDLEARNTTLQHEFMNLQTQVEKLKHELTKVNTENKILRATSGSASNGPTPFLTELDELVGPLGFQPTDYTAKLSTNDNRTTNWSPDSKWAQFGTITTVAVDDDSGEPLLNASATWDYIQSHELFKEGLVDVGDVCERLKGMARCDGQGPVFQESDVRRVISESAVAGGRDELI